MNGVIAKSLWRAGLALLAASLVTVGILAVTDVANGFRSSKLHSDLGALALITIGASYVCLQVISRRPRRALVKGIILGTAFVLWGIEQFLPAGRWTTAMDTAVIVIFVVDMGMVLMDGPERPLP
jgi:hypothetical protein